MVRCEFQILVCVCRFPVDSDRNSVVSTPLDECVLEWELGIFFSFNGELGLGVKAVDVLKKSCKLDFRITEKTSSTWRSQTFGGWLVVVKAVVSVACM